MTHTRFRGWLAFILIVVASMLTMASIDLVLPAVPEFPRIFSTTIALSQLSIAAYTGGAAIGFLLFGTLGSHYSRAKLLSVSFAGFGLVSLACAYVNDIHSLTVLRGIQGVLSAAPGVFAPAIINAVFDERRAMRAMSLMGSIQTLAPALAPILGLWMLGAYGWQSSFYLIAFICLPIAAVFLAMRHRLPMGKKISMDDEAAKSSYRVILKNRAFWRYSLSHALILGGLVGFMLGAPNVFVNVLGLTMRDFIIVQVSSIAAFIITTNIASHADHIIPLERMIWTGKWISTAAAFGLLAFALMGGTAFMPVLLAGVFMNVGVGMSGPMSFFLAIKSARGDDTRASALAVLWVLLAIAGATSATAPFLQYGLWSLGAIAAVMHTAGMIVFFMRK